MGVLSDDLIELLVKWVDDRPHPTRCFFLLLMNRQFLRVLGFPDRHPRHPPHRLVIKMFRSKLSFFPRPRNSLWFDPTWRHPRMFLGLAKTDDLGIPILNWCHEQHGDLWNPKLCRDRRHPQCGKLENWLRHSVSEGPIPWHPKLGYTALVNGNHDLFRWFLHTVKGFMPLSGCLEVVIKRQCLSSLFCLFNLIEMEGQFSNHHVNFIQLMNWFFETLPPSRSLTERADMIKLICGHFAQHIQHHSYLVTRHSHWKNLVYQISRRVHTPADVELFTLMITVCKKMTRLVLLSFYSWMHRGFIENDSLHLCQGLMSLIPEFSPGACIFVSGHPSWDCSHWHLWLALCRWGTREQIISHSLPEYYTHPNHWQRLLFPQVIHRTDLSFWKWFFALFEVSRDPHFDLKPIFVCAARTCFPELIRDLQPHIRNIAFKEFEEESLTEELFQKCLIRDDRETWLALEEWLFSLNFTKNNTRAILRVCLKLAVRWAPLIMVSWLLDRHPFLRHPNSIAWLELVKKGLSREHNPTESLIFLDQKIRPTFSKGRKTLFASAEATLMVNRVQKWTSDPRNHPLHCDHASFPLADRLDRALEVKALWNFISSRHITLSSCQKQLLLKWTRHLDTPHVCQPKRVDSTLLM